MIRLPPSRWYDPRTSTRGPRFTVQVQWGKSKSCWKDLIPNGGENWKNSPRSLNGLPVLLRGVGTLEKNFREIRCRYRHGASTAQVLIMSWTSSLLSPCSHTKCSLLGSMTLVAEHLEQWSHSVCVRLPGGQPWFQFTRFRHPLVCIRREFKLISLPTSRNTEGHR